MLSNMAKITFIVRTTRSHRARRILYCRITCQMVSREFSTEQELRHPEKWNQEKQLYELENDEGEFINLLCDKLRYNIKTICIDNSEITPDEIIHQVKAPKQKARCFQDLVTDYYNWEVENNSVLKLSAKTLTHHKNYVDKLKVFEPKSISVSCADSDWCERFFLWMRTKNNCKHNARINRHIRYYRKALEKAKKQKKIKGHELGLYECISDPEKDIVYFNNEERLAWLTWSAIPGLAKSHKTFSFQMRVGVSFMDLWATYQVQEVPGAGKILVGRRGKTGECFFVPYDPEAEEILKSFNYSMPRIDNSTYNKEIKLIAAILGITKKISTHTARKTFIMQRIAEGWDLITTKDMAGHKSYRTTERYYREPTPDRLINEMITRQNKKPQAPME